MSRKKKPDTGPSLFGEAVTAPVVRAYEPPKAIAPVPVEPAPTPVPPQAEPSAPRLRLVPPPEKDIIIVEALDDGMFWISRLRESGTTVAAVRYTRAELDELRRRIDAALEVG